ncbi:MAG: CehA/McbA family metallohydrolase [Candidatus Ornithospirochaeta sp.]
MVVIKELKGKLLYGKESEDQSKKFFFASFQVSEKLNRMRVTVTTHCTEFCQIPFSLISPSGEIRMMKTEEGGKGDYSSSSLIGIHSSERGGLSGEIEEGEWTLILHKRRFSCDVDVDVLVEGEREEEKEENDAQVFFHGVKKKEEGWYRGELHVHSNHSTGRSSIPEILDVAKNLGLDFLAITDHFTASHWEEEARYSSSVPFVLLQSMELSGDKGHANLHGIRSIKSPYVDDDGTLSRLLGKKLPDMETIADEVHSEGGLFSINHPDSNIASAWRYHSFPTTKADIIEVWCTSEGEFSLRYPAIWDSLLLSGHHITGTASSDSHKAKDHEMWALGNVTTWVWAEELSEKGILDGLKKGRVFMAKGEARMDFYAETRKGRAHMGESVEIDDQETFVVKLENVPRGNMFVYISGALDDVVPFGEGSHTWSFKPKEMSGRDEEYVRLEYYETPSPPRFWGDAPRSQSTLTLLSNPIYLRK